MIRCGVSLGEKGCWEEGQLSKELEEIIVKYRANFEGQDLACTHCKVKDLLPLCVHE